MGGYGSGRKSQFSCTDESISLDIRCFPRGVLSKVGTQLILQDDPAKESVQRVSATIGNGSIVFSYAFSNNGNEIKNARYPVKFQTTPCRYGGVRYWFICPSVGCAKRVGVLYGGIPFFMCRSCCHLTYRSRREAEPDRALRRVLKTKIRLGWEQAMTHPRGSKPKGMHHQTFYRLVQEYSQSMQKLIFKGFQHYQIRE